MYKYSDIRTVHLEITTRCNARCPQCPRNLWGGAVNPSLPQVELSLDDCRKLFPPDFVRQLRLLYMCGDYGDPVVAADTLEVFSYLRGCSEVVALKMHTNGGARPPAWWERLARTGCAVRFAIDGMADTNHLYRRGTNWATIVENACAFIRAGGSAEWAFIAFRHNEHQIEEARRLARELGFKRFILKRTKRFLNFSKGERTSSFPVRGMDGEIEYYLEPPASPAYQIPLTEPWAGGDDYEEYLRTTPITCRAVKERMVYVTAEGLALPCCWLGNLYPREFAESRPQVWSLVDGLPEKRESLNALRRGLKRVVEDTFFQQRVPEHWQPAQEAGQRLKVCVKVCGGCSVQDNQNAEFAV
jgi:MoaA/NifB/PqqE/SkfB family radical SAM enzyme